MRVLKPGGEKPFGTLGTRAPVSEGQEGGGPERRGQVSSRGAGVTGTEGNGNPPEEDCKGEEERPCPSWKLLASRTRGATFIYSADPLQSFGGYIGSVGFCEDLGY